MKFEVIKGMITSPNFQKARKYVKSLCKQFPQCCVSCDIRDLTEVQWYEYLPKIQRTYGGDSFHIKKPVVCFVNSEYIGDDRKLMHWISERFDVNICRNWTIESLSKFDKFIKKSKRTHVYMQITIKDKLAGTLIFQLYDDLLPVTCDNFLKLCKKRKHGYTNRPVHRIVKDCYIQVGGYELKSHKIPDEGFYLPHNCRGVLSMAKKSRHLHNNTQFLVSLCPAPWMNTHYTAFGQLIDGNDTLSLIELVPTHYEQPTVNVEIIKCGVFEPSRFPTQEQIEHVQKHVAQDIEDVCQTATWIKNIMVNNALEIIKRKEYEKLMMDPKEEESKMISEDEGEEKEENKSACVSVSSCSCAKGACDVCGRTHWPFEIYWPNHDVSDFRNAPSAFCLDKYNEGLYCAETDLMPYMLPYWMRGMNKSDVTLNEEAKHSFCKGLYEEALVRSEMTSSQALAKKIINIVMAEVNTVLSTKYNLPDFTILPKKKLNFA